MTIERDVIPPIPTTFPLPLVLRTTEPPKMLIMFAGGPIAYKAIFEELEPPIALPLALPVDSNELARMEMVVPTEVPPR